MLRWLLLALGSGIALAACGAEPKGGEYTGPLMRPGEDCLSCHSEGAGRGAPTWSAGGTVYAKADAKADEGVKGVDVLLSAPDGRLIEKLVTNEVGNFYTNTPLPSGFKVALEYQGERIDMPCPPPAGLCNVCHNSPPLGAAPGRIYVPQGADPTRPAFQCSNSMAPAASNTGGGGAPANAAGSSGSSGSSGVSGAAAGSGGAAAGAGGDSNAMPKPSCTGEASYDITVDITWNDAKVDSRHYTTLIGAVHSDALSLWQPGALATPGIQAMAESGKISTLASEVEAAISAGSALAVVQFGGGSSPSKSQGQATVSAQFPRLSLGSMMAPTPDLFIGLSSLNLCENGAWIATKQVSAIVYDAGTKNGNAFTYGDGPTQPHAPIGSAAQFTTPVGTITLQKR
jgi:Spondin_N